VRVRLAVDARPGASSSDRRPCALPVRVCLYSCCTRCGAVLDDAIFSTDATFIKGPGGQAQVRGSQLEARLCSSVSQRLTPLVHLHCTALHQADGTFVPESGVARALGPRGARGFTFPADSHEKTLQKGTCAPLALFVHWHSSATSTRLTRCATHTQASRK